MIAPGAACGLSHLTYAAPERSPIREWRLCTRGIELW